MDASRETADSRGTFVGLRARLVLIVLAAMLPFAAFIVYDAAVQCEAALTEARSGRRSLAQFPADDLETRLGAARHLLHGLAEATSMRDTDQAGRTKVLATGLAERLPDWIAGWEERRHAPLDFRS